MSNISLSGPPLQGIRILDLTIAVAGPYGTRILGDLGAEVIKIDTRSERQYATELDLAARLQGIYVNADPGEEPWNAGGAHAQLNRNKSSIVLELGSDKGRSQFLELVRSADCIIENFTPKVMPHLGLGHEFLLEVNPHLVYVAMPGFGTYGPRSGFPAFAPTTEASAGFLSLLGYTDGTHIPNRTSLADYVGGLNAVVGLLSALWRARDTGEGAFVDLSQVEAMATFMGEEFLTGARSIGEAGRLPLGNQPPSAELADVFPARGFDEWIAISLYSIEEVKRLGHCLGGPTLSSRWAACWGEIGRQQLRSELAEHTCKYGKTELAVTLQGIGIAAAPVNTAPDLLADPQLNHLDFFLMLDAPGVGSFPYEGPPWHFGDWPNRLTNPAPRLGADTDRIIESPNDQAFVRGIEGLRKGE